MLNPLLLGDLVTFTPEAKRVLQLFAILCTDNGLKLFAKIAPDTSRELDNDNAHWQLKFLAILYFYPTCVARRALCDGHVAEVRENVTKFILNECKPWL